MAAEPQSLASWYAQGLTALNWDTVPPGASRDRSVIEREFRKGEGGQILLRITPLGTGGSRVEASVGIGVPVTPVQ